MKLTFLDYSETNRLTLASVFALALHGILVWGIQFTNFAEPARSVQSSLHVSLLEKAGGEPLISHKESPPVSVARPEAKNSMTPTTAAPRSPVDPTPPPKPAPAKAPEPSKALAAVVPSVVKSAVQTPKRHASIEPESAVPPEHEPAPSPGSPQPMPSAADLINSGLQLARMQAAPRPQTSNARERHFDPESMTTLEKFYIQGWVRKVEQVGTLNFPEEARRLRLTGKLTLDVAVSADGSVQKITLMRSSGHKVLDKAAHEIVELAAPYAEFPAEMRQKYDILHIRRTWQFLQGNRLSGK